MILFHEFGLFWLRVIFHPSLWFVRNQDHRTELGGRVLHLDQVPDPRFQTFSDSTKLVQLG